jgi:murein L,D-transpeptidase YafK
MSLVITLIKRLLQLVLIIMFLIVCAVGWANYRSNPLPEGVKADRIVVEKSARHLSLYWQNTLLKQYSVSLGKSPEGKKVREGDRRTPEGVYKIDFRKNDSAYHLALHVSYPNAADVKNAKKGGFPPGGAIMIHGMRNGLGWIGNLHRLVDWTNGCIAVTDWEVDEISRAVPDGTVIEVKP